MRTKVAFAPSCPEEIARTFPTRPASPTRAPPVTATGISLHRPSGADGAPAVAATPARLNPAVTHAHVRARSTRAASAGSAAPLGSYQGSAAAVAAASPAAAAGVSSWVQLRRAKLRRKAEEEADAVASAAIPPALHPLAPPAPSQLGAAPATGAKRPAATFHAAMTSVARKRIAIQPPRGCPPMLPGGATHLGCHLARKVCAYGGGTGGWFGSHQDADRLLTMGTRGSQRPSAWKAQRCDSLRDLQTRRGCG